MAGRRARFEFDRRFRPRRFNAPQRVRTPDGLWIWAIPNDMVGRGVFLYGSQEWSSLKVFEALLRPGDVVIDAGAHVGTYTLRAARAAGAAGRVVAFEPEPATRELLLRALVENNLDNVTVQSEALSKGEATLRLEAPPRGARNSGATRVRIDPEGQIVGRALDDVLPELGIEHVDAIKIDVEGHTLEVLSGARRTIERDCPMLLVEVDDETWDEVADELARSEYEFSITRPRDTRRWPVNRDEVVASRPAYEALNVFATHPARPKRT